MFWWQKVSHRPTFKVRRFPEEACRGCEQSWGTNDSCKHRNRNFFQKNAFALTKDVRFSASGINAEKKVGKEYNESTLFVFPLKIKTHACFLWRRFQMFLGAWLGLCNVKKFCFSPSCFSCLTCHNPVTNNHTVRVCRTLNTFFSPAVTNMCSAHAHYGANWFDFSPSDILRLGFERPVVLRCAFSFDGASLGIKNAKQAFRSTPVRVPLLPTPYLLMRACRRAGVKRSRAPTKWPGMKYTYIALPCSPWWENSANGWKVSKVESPTWPLQNEKFDFQNDQANSTTHPTLCCVMRIYDEFPVLECRECQNRASVPVGKKDKKSVFVPHIAQNNTLCRKNNDRNRLQYKAHCFQFACNFSP